MANVEVTGMQELLDKVAELGLKSSRIQNEALLKGAEPILQDAVNNAPEKDGKGKLGLKLSRPKIKGGTKFVLIGIDKGDISEIYYMKFHEFGAAPHQISSKKGNEVIGGIVKSTKNTSVNHPGIRAKPFLQPALDKNKRKAQSIISEVLKRGLGL